MNPPKVTLVTAYGLRWKLAETEFVSSPISRNRRRLVGRRGHGRNRRVADFYRLPGFYVLIWKGKPVYFGIAPKGGIGDRIYKHAKDAKKEWDEFSWFGYGTMKSNLKRLEIPSTEVLGPLSHKGSVQDFEHVVRLSLKLPLMKGKPGFRAGSKNILWDQVMRQKVRPLLKAHAAAG